MTSATIDLSPRAALILVDVQESFSDAEQWGRRNNPECEANIGELLAHWRRTGRPVVFVRHDSQEPGSSLQTGHPGNRFQDVISGAADLLVTKSVNSSFHGVPDLHAWLQDEGIGQIVIAGITTNHCCETTARVGGNLGYDVLFALDATHTFDRLGPDGDTVSADELWRITGVNLHGEFATVVTTADLVAAR